MVLIDAAIGLVLVWVALTDLRHYRIPNAAILVLAALVLLSWLDGRHPSVWPYCVIAGVSLLLLFGAFAQGWIGGGDAKLLTLALAFIGPFGATVFSLLLLLCVGLYALGARLGRLPARRVGRRLQIPFGPAIAAAWIGFLALSAAS